MDSEVCQRKHEVNCSSHHPLMTAAASATAPPHSVSPSVSSDGGGTTDNDGYSMLFADPSCHDAAYPGVWVGRLLAVAIMVVVCQ